MSDADFLRWLADELGVAGQQHAGTCARLREIAGRIEADNERHSRYVKAVGELAGIVAEQPIGERVHPICNYCGSDRCLHDVETRVTGIMPVEARHP